VTAAGRLAALAGLGGAAAVAFVVTQWLGGDRGAPDDVGRVAIRDVLIARDAQVHEGRLEGCNASSCELDGRHFERRALAFIGLGVESTTPPPVEDPSQDELHLRGGGVVHEPLAQIDEDAVFVGARRFERNEVTWVALAAETEPPGSQGAAEPESEPDPPEPPPPPPDPPTEPPTDPGQRPPVRRPRPANDLVKPCPPDRPLGGSLELEYVHTLEHRYRCDQQARLWFGLIPMDQIGKWPAPLGSPHHSDAITYQLSWDCSDLPDPHGEVCDAPGATRSGRTDFGPIGPLGVANQSGGVTFYPMDPKLSFALLDEINAWQVPDVQCVYPNGSGGNAGRGWGGIGGSVEPWGPGDCEIGPCVAPTACYQPEGELRRDCVLHPDRYAAIPFEGSERRRLLPGTGGLNSGEFIDMSTRWRVCCGCGQAPSGPPPDFAPRKPDDCEDAAAALAALIGRMRGLAAAYRSHEAAFACAQRRRDEWRDKVWGLGGSLAGFSATLPGTAPGAGPRYQTLAALLPALHRILSGDSSALSQFETAVDVAANDDVMNQAQSRALQMLRQAFRAWYEHVSRGADLREAARAYKAQVRHIKEAFGDVRQAGKALQSVTGLINMAYAASSLADQIAAYAEWRQEAQRDQQAMEDAQDQMRDVQLEITQLHARCPDLPPPPREEPPPTPASRCPERPGGSGGGEPSASVLPGPASPVLGDFALAATGDSSPEADLAALRERSSALAAIEERAVARTADEILPLLAPFLFHQTEDLSQELLLELLADVRPHLEALVADLDEAAALGREIESAARRLAPQSAGSSTRASAREPGNR
jgi:hypothetical protein